MQLKRVATFAIGSAALAAWLAAAMTSGDRPPIIIPASAPSAIDASGAELASEIARLRERLRPAAVPSRPGRNLFAFGQARSEAPPPVGRTPAPIEPTAQPAPSVVTLPIALVGIAEDATADGTMRTAILSGGGDLVLAKEGDRVLVRYRVEKISADVVELIDLDDGSVKRLALK